MLVGQGSVGMRSLSEEKIYSQRELDELYERWIHGEREHYDYIVYDGALDCCCLTSQRTNFLASGFYRLPLFCFISVHCLFGFGWIWGFTS